MSQLTFIATALTCTTGIVGEHRLSLLPSSSRRFLTDWSPR
jgi:hypothetical protein